MNTLPPELKAVLHRAYARAVDPDVVAASQTLRQEARERRARSWDRLSPAPHFAGARVELLDDAVRKPVQSWLAQLVAIRDPGTLLLCGPLGAGKTYAACAVARQAYVEGFTTSYVQAARVVASVSWTANEEWFHSDVLVLDDLGLGIETESGKHGVSGVLADLIDRRWSAGRPVVVTSNHTPAQLGEVVGARSWDRLADRITLVGFGGNTRRGRT